MESVGISKILIYLCQSTGSHISEGRDNIRIHCRDNFVAEKIFLFAGNMPEVNLTVQLLESLRPSVLDPDPLKLEVRVIHYHE